MRTTRTTGIPLTVGLAAVLTGAALLAGCIRIPLGEFGTVGKPSMSKGSTSATSAPAPISPAMVGSWLSAGSWKVLVIRARTSSKGPGGAKAAPGMSFLLIDVEFKNARMTETLVVNPKDASLRDASGKKIAAVGGTTTGYNARGMREIGPGYGGGTVFAYQIPKGSSGYTFTFSPKVGGKRAKLQWGVP